MDIAIPSAATVREKLHGLTLKQIAALGEASGIPPSTIYKIKRGETENPGIDTCRRIMEQLPTIRLAQSLPTAEAS